jgi:hypothetical protein
MEQSPSCGHSCCSAAQELFYLYPEPDKSNLIPHKTAWIPRNFPIFFFVNFLGVGWDWVHLVCRPLTGLLYQPRIDDDECGAVSGMRIGRGNQNTRIKPAPVPLSPPQIPYDLTWARTRSASVGSQWLTVWAIAWPFLTVSMKDNIFRDVTACNLMGSYKLLGTTYWFHLQVGEVNQASRVSLFPARSAYFSTLKMQSPVFDGDTIFLRKRIEIRKKRIIMKP